MSFWRDPIVFIINWVKGLLASIPWGPGWATTVGFVIGAFVLAAGAMFFVVFLIWYERKLIGRFQDRFGPNRLGPFGLFQPIADMLKIFTKELITPVGVDWVAYNLAPILSVAAVLMMWAVTPFSKTFFGVNISVGILFLIAVGGLGEVGILLAGWGSNNKYALVGALRAIAQLISYEVPFVISALVPVMLSGSMSLVDIVEAQQPWYISSHRRRLSSSSSPRSPRPAALLSTWLKPNRRLLPATTSNIPVSNSACFSSANFCTPSPPRSSL